MTEILSYIKNLDERKIYSSLIRKELSKKNEVLEENKFQKKLSKEHQRGIEETKDDYIKERKEERKGKDGSEIVTK